MKLWIKYLVVLSIATNSAVAQEWTTTELTDFATIDFPSIPDRVDTLGGVFFTNVDSTAVFIVNVRDLSDQQNLDLTIDELPDFYQGAIEGALDEVDGQLITQKNFEINGLTGVEIEYSTNSPLLPEVRYKRVLFINPFIFNYDLWTTQELKESAMLSKDRFFGSLTITHDNPKQYSITHEEELYQKSFAVGRIIGFIVIIGGFIAVIILIRYLISKGKK